MATAAELQSLDNVVTCTTDVTSEADPQRTVERCASEFGAVDVMVNNAGITRDATMPRMPLSDFLAVLNVHLVGAWLGTRTAAITREQQSGSIINISSISGRIGNIGQANYSSAQAGIVGLTKASAKELAHLGVRVNAIQPGLIRTAMTAGLSSPVFAHTHEEQSSPLGIWHRVEDEVEPAGFAGELGEVQT